MATPPTLITLSFSGDLELCRLLCETVDQFGPDGAGHVVAVPSSDMSLFRPLAGGRRILVPQEDLIPRWLRKLPLPSPAWRKRLFLPRRNIYLSLKGRPVRGWIAQQIMKLNAAAGAETDTIVHLDSDLALVRPLPVEVLAPSGRVRLGRYPGADNDALHAPWHRAASALLGLPPSDYHAADYVDQIVTWRRTNVRGLLARIGETTGRDPIEVLAATPHFSEYILYGVYCDKVLGLEASGHIASGQSLCETVWTKAAATEIPVVGATRYGLGIQSTIPMATAYRRRLVAEAIDRASAMA